MLRTIISSKDLDDIKSNPGDSNNFKEKVSNYRRAGLVEKNADDLTPAELNDLSYSIQKKPDDYLTKLVKYIPAEVVALYLTLKPLVVNETELYWFIFLFGVLATPLYLWKIQNVNKKKQLLLSTLAFIVWVFAIGGPFDQFTLKEAYKTVAFTIVTFTIPFIDP